MERILLVSGAIIVGPWEGRTLGLGRQKKWINFRVENYLLPIKVANIELDRLLKKCFGKLWPSIGTHN